MSASMTEFHPISKEQREEFGLDSLARFRANCFEAIIKSVDSAGPHGLGSRALFAAVRAEIDTLYGQGSYRWETLESNLDVLVNRDSLMIEQGRIARNQ